LEAVELAKRALELNESRAGALIVDLPETERLTLYQAVLRGQNINATLGVLKILAESPTPALTASFRVALRSSTETIRMAVLDTIASSQRKALNSDVVARLNDDFSEVQATACDTLRALNVNTADVHKAVFTRLSSRSKVVRAACSDAFARIEGSQSMREEVAALLLAKSVFGRLGALRVLSAWGTNSDLDLVRGRLADENEEVVAMAMAAVSCFSGVLAVKELERFIRDPREIVRIEAVAGLERQPPELVKNSVYEALKDTSPAVRIEAAAQLSRYPDDPETLIRLHALLRDESVGVRASTGIALRELSNSRSFGPVAEQLKVEPSAEVRVDLWRTLAAAGPQKAVPICVAALATSEKQEKTTILSILREVTGQSFPADAEQWKKWLAEQTVEQPKTP
jgi:hypothetical protein